MARITFNKVLDAMDNLGIKASYFNNCKALTINEAQALADKLNAEYPDCADLCIRTKKSNSNCEYSELFILGKTKKITSLKVEMA